jgi:hypothetical protein
MLLPFRKRTPHLVENTTGDHLRLLDPAVAFAQRSLLRLGGASIFNVAMRCGGPDAGVTSERHDRQRCGPPDVAASTHEELADPGRRETTA